MVRHETPRSNADTIPNKLILEQREHPIAIFIVFKDADAAITACDYMVIACNETTLPVLGISLSHHKPTGQHLIGADDPIC